MKTRSSQQLNTGFPSAFDHSSSSNLVAVSSENNVFLYNFDWKGVRNASPRQIIFNECPQTISLLKFQKSVAQPLLSLACDGLTSIWDLNKPNTPLNHFVPIMGFTTDLQWSIFDKNILATATEQGTLCTWDIRIGSSTLRPVAHFSFGREACSAVQYCPSNGNLLSCLSAGKVSIFDIRKPFTKGNSAATDDGIYGRIKSLSSINQYVWANEEAIFTWNADSLGYWQQAAVSQGGQESKGLQESKGDQESINSTSSKQYTMTHSFYNSDISSSGMLLAEPSGKGVVLSVHSHARGLPFTPMFLSPPASGCSVSLHTIGLDSFTNLDCFESDISPICNSYKTVARHNSEIVGMQWAEDMVPDRLGPGRGPSFVVLTAASVLHTIRVDAQSFEGDKDNVRTSGQGQSTPLPPFNKGLSPLDNKALNTERVPPARSRFPIDCLKGRLLGPKPLGSIESVKSNKKAAQTASSGATSNSNSSNVQSSISNTKLGPVGPHTFLALIEETVGSLELSIASGLLAGMRISHIDQFARRIHLELLIPTKDPLMTKNYNYYYNEDLKRFRKNGAVNGRIIELVFSFPLKQHYFWTATSYAIECRFDFEFWNDSLSADLVEVLTELHKKSASTIDFSPSSKGMEHSHASHTPAHVQGSRPYRFSSGAGLNHPSPSTLHLSPTKDLNTGSDSPCCSSVLLLESAKVFRTAVLEAWERQLSHDRQAFPYLMGSFIEDSSVALCHLADRPLGMPDPLTMGWSAKGKGAEQKVADLLQQQHDAQYAKTIEQRAFIVPFPRSSSGIFSSTGSLVCFGKASLSLVPQPLDQDINRSMPFEGIHEVPGFHNSYANVMIKAFVDNKKALVEAGSSRGGSRRQSSSDLSAVAATSRAVLPATFPKHMTMREDDGNVEDEDEEEEDEDDEDEDDEDEDDDDEDEDEDEEDEEEEKVRRRDAPSSSAPSPPPSTAPILEKKPRKYSEDTPDTMDDDEELHSSSQGEDDEEDDVQFTFDQDEQEQAPEKEEEEEEEEEEEKAIDTMDTTDTTHPMITIEKHVGSGLTEEEDQHGEPMSPLSPFSPTTPYSSQHTLLSPIQEDREAPSPLDYRATVASSADSAGYLGGDDDSRTATDSPTSDNDAVSDSHGTAMEEEEEEEEEEEKDGEEVDGDSNDSGDGQAPPNSYLSDPSKRLGDVGAVVGIIDIVDDIVDGVTGEGKDSVAGIGCPVHAIEDSHDDAVGNGRRGNGRRSVRAEDSARDAMQASDRYPANPNTAVHHTPESGNKVSSTGLTIDTTLDGSLPCTQSADTPVAVALPVDSAIEIDHTVIVTPSSPPSMGISGVHPQLETPTSFSTSYAAPPTHPTHLTPPTHPTHLTPPSPHVPRVSPPLSTPSPDAVVNSHSQSSSVMSDMTLACPGSASQASRKVYRNQENNGSGGEDNDVDAENGNDNDSGSGSGEEIEDNGDDVSIAYRTDNDNDSRSGSGSGEEVEDNGDDVSIAYRTDEEEGRTSTMSQPHRMAVIGYMRQLRDNASSTVRVYDALYGTERLLAVNYTLGPLVSSLKEGSVSHVSFESSSFVMTRSDIDSRIAACKHNAAVVEELVSDCDGLAQYWNVLAVALSIYSLSDDVGDLISWKGSILGCKLLFRMVRYLINLNDLQLYATTICVFGGAQSLLSLLTPFHIDSSTSYLVEAPWGEQNQSNKAGLDKAGLNKAGLNKAGLVDPVMLGERMDRVLYEYAEVLQQWGEGILSTEVRKKLYDGGRKRVPGLEGSLAADTDKFFLRVHAHCSMCGILTGDGTKPLKPIASLCLDNRAADYENVPDSRPDPIWWCDDCQEYAHKCAVCELPLRGLSGGLLSVCYECGHGGHANHMKMWFDRNDECPTGCGCRCGKRTAKKAEEDYGYYGDCGDELYDDEVKQDGGENEDYVYGDVEKPSVYNIFFQDDVQMLVGVGNYSVFNENYYSPFNYSGYAEDTDRARDSPR